MLPFDVSFELTVVFPGFSVPTLGFSLLMSATALQCFFQKVVPPVRAYLRKSDKD